MSIFKCSLGYSKTTPHVPDVVEIIIQCNPRCRAPQSKEVLFCPATRDFRFKEVSGQLVRLAQLLAWSYTPIYRKAPALCLSYATR